jgi:hypothetical protein
MCTCGGGHARTGTTRFQSGGYATVAVAAVLGGVGTAIPFSLLAVLAVVGFVGVGVRATVVLRGGALGLALAGGADPVALAGYTQLHGPLCRFVLAAAATATTTVASVAKDFGAQVQAVVGVGRWHRHRDGRGHGGAHRDAPLGPWRTPPPLGAARHLRHPLLHVLDRRCRPRRRRPRLAHSAGPAPSVLAHRCHRHVAHAIVPVSAISVAEPCVLPMAVLCLAGRGFATPTLVHRPCTPTLALHCTAGCHTWHTSTEHPGSRPTHAVLLFVSFSFGGALSDASRRRRRHRRHRPALQRTRQSGAGAAGRAARPATCRLTRRCRTPTRPWARGRRTPCRRGR